MYRPLVLILVAAFIQSPSYLQKELAENLAMTAINDTRCSYQQKYDQPHQVLVSPIASP